MSEGVAFGAGCVVGVLVGAVLTLGIQAWTLPSLPGVSPANARPLVPHPSAPETFLAWVPRGLPDGIRRAVRRLPTIGALTVVAEDNVWLARSWSAAGELVDHPERPYRIPLDAAAVDPASFAPFLPPADREHARRGRERRGDPRVDLRLGPRTRPRRDPRLREGSAIRIAAVLPDELVGAAELLVSEETGRRSGSCTLGICSSSRREGRARRPGSLRRTIRPLAARRTSASSGGAGARAGRDPVLPGGRRRPPSGAVESALRRVRRTDREGPARVHSRSTRMDDARIS